MEITLYIPDQIDSPTREFRAFLQHMCYRYAQGSFRYGSPKRSRRYMTRLHMENKAYRESGNIENLANVAVYAALESIAPEHPNQHFDAYAASVTRGKIKGQAKGH